MELKSKEQENQTPTAAEIAKNGTVCASSDWDEARLAYPIYAALGKQLRMGSLPFENSFSVPDNPSPEVRARLLQWLDEVDANAKAYQIRQLPLAIFNHSEPALRALSQRHLRKAVKTDVDRDKIDFLLVQYFALCAPESMYHQDITPEDAKSVLKPVIPNAEARTPQWCEALDTIIDHLKNADSLRALLQTGYLKESRGLKESAGEKFYQPESLLTFTRFNFLMRRNFIRLLHCDQKAVARAIDQLEQAEVRTVDCSRAGLSASESTAQVRQFVQGWRPQSHLDYSEGAVVRSFEQLFALRADLEEAVRATKGSAGAQNQSSPAAASGADAHPAAEMKPSAANAQVPAANKPPASVATVGSWDKQQCAKAIGDQLQGAHANAARPMSTVTLQGTKLLLSSWELGAFHAGASAGSDSIRDAVVARAMLAMAIDDFKKSNAVAPLKVAVEVARADVPNFQKVIENMKNERNIEPAVNLNISVKRLSAFLSEAEKLIA